MPTLPYTPGPTPTSAMRSIMAQYHRDMQAQVDHTLADLAGRWQGVQANLANTIHNLERQMAAAERAGQTIDTVWLAQERRLLDLKAAVAGDVARFATEAKAILGDAQLSAVASGTQAAQEAMAAAMQGVAGQPIGHTFNVVPEDVLHQIAGATQPYSPLSQLFTEFGADASAAAQAALFQSVALGEGAKVAAQRLVYATNMSAQRAEVIARTEIMRSWRGAQFASYRANSDVVQAWQWAADFGPRCCFPAGTLVETRRGALPIEQVRVGDEALTHTGRYRRVTETLHRAYDGALVTLTAVHPQATPSMPSREVTATADHPFLVDHLDGFEREWVGAAYIPVTSTVVMMDGPATLIRVFYSNDPATHQTVYNLEVEDDHSYVANGFVVHNCGACMAMDGSIHPLTELLDDHICGRCAALPLTASYSDLLAGTGADMGALASADELEGEAFPVHESGEAWLSKQEPAMQNRILGPAKAEAWRSGDLKLSQLVGVRHDPVWGSSIEERSLRSLGLDAQKYLALARGNGTASSLVDEAGLARAAEGTPQRALSAWEQRRAEMIAQAEGRAAPLDMTVNPDVKFIAEKDVAAWASENPADVPGVGYHYGTSEHITRLTNEGIDVTRGNQRGFYGRGFYMFKAPQTDEELKGIVLAANPDEMQVAIHMTHPWAVDYEDWQKMEDSVMSDHPDWNRFGSEFADEVTNRLKEQGYDGAAIFMDESRSQAEILAFEPGTVRVINDAKAAEEAQAAGASVARPSAWEMERQRLIDLANGVTPAETAAATEAEAAQTLQTAEKRVSAAATGASLQAEADALRAVVQPEFENTASFEEAAQAMVERQQAKVALLADNPDWQAFVKAMDRQPYSIAGFTFTPEMQALDVLEGSWTALVMDEEPINVALRQSAADLFHLDIPARTIDPAVQAQADAFLADYGGAVRAYVQATYDQTQQWFADQGITEMTLYRGMNGKAALEGLAYDGAATPATLTGAAFSSYSADPTLALDFARSTNYLAGEYQAMSAVRVPVSEVFGTPFTSMAKQTESEFLLFGSAQPGVILSWQGAEAAPDLSAALDRLAGAMPSQEE